MFTQWFQRENPQAERTRERIVEVLRTLRDELAAIGQAPEAKWEVPPHWMIYFNVRDVDATVRRAEALGARIKVYWDGIPKVEVDDATFPSGRVGVVSSQSAARFDNVVVVLFATIVIFVFRGFTISRRSRDSFGSLLAAGVTIWIITKAMMNIADARLVESIECRDSSLLPVFRNSESMTSSS